MSKAVILRRLFVEGMLSCTYTVPVLYIYLLSRGAGNQTCLHSCKPPSGPHRLVSRLGTDSGSDCAPLLIMLEQLEETGAELDICTFGRARAGLDWPVALEGSGPSSCSDPNDMHQSNVADGIEMAVPLSL